LRRSDSNEKRVAAVKLLAVRIAFVDARSNSVCTMFRNHGFPDEPSDSERHLVGGMLAFPAPGYAATRKHGVGPDFVFGTLP
jgi:hypothetical protein